MVWIIPKSFAGAISGRCSHASRRSLPRFAAILPVFLAVVLAVVLTPDAQAQREPVTVWEAELTVRSHIGNLGCFRTPQETQFCSDWLSDDYFEYEDRGYEFLTILLYPSGELHLTFNRSITQNAKDTLTLNVGDTVLAFANGAVATNTVFWANTGLAWSYGDKVQLTITTSDQELLTRPLVSNYDETGLNPELVYATPVTQHTTTVGQAFTTGSHSDGYRLKSVQIKLSDLTPGGVVVSLWTAEYDGYREEYLPDSLLFTFDNPDPLRNGSPAFSPPEKVKLTPQTPYLIVFKLTDGATSVNLYRPVSLSEDSGGAPGWSIFHRRIAGLPPYYSTYIGLSTYPIVMRLNGSLITSNPATGAPVISGVTQVGRTLTADTDDIRDGDGLGEFSYQWLRVDGASEAVITGATGPAYVVQDQDLGKALKVRVSFTDGEGRKESLTSAATAKAIVSVCDRTPQVRDGLVAATGAQDCSSVTAGAVAELTLLNLNDTGITALLADDFQGLPALRWLYLDDNLLESLPAGIFQPIPTTIDIISVQRNPGCRYHGSGCFAPTPHLRMEIAGAAEEDLIAEGGQTVTLTADIGAYQDPLGRRISYAWEQKTGTEVELDISSDGRTATFLSPAVGGAENAAFSVTVKAAWGPWSTITNGNFWGSAAAEIELTLRPSNSPPSFSAGPVARSLPENAAGREVGDPVAAADPDSWDTLTYGISGPNPGGFTIDPATGQLRSGPADNYDFEDAGKNSYQVTVTVSDGRLTDSVTVTITVADVNELPVFGEGPAAARQLDENTGGDPLGAPLIAADPDAGDTLTYGISGPNPGGFTIDPGTGQLRSGPSANYNHEDTPSYQVTVKVSDGQGLGDSVAVTITVADVNEPPVFGEGPAAARQLDENTGGGPLGAPLTAIDPDAGDTLTYRISGPNPGGFTIGASTGQLRSGPSANYNHEDTPSYRVTVTVSDGRLADSIAVTINVADVAEPPGRLGLLTVADETASSLSVAWIAPDNEGRPPITGYDLRYSGNREESWIEGPKDVAGTSATLDGLGENICYSIQARGKNPEGDGGWSPSGYGFTSAGPPGSEDDVPGTVLWRAVMASAPRGPKPNHGQGYYDGSTTDFGCLSNDSFGIWTVGGIILAPRSRSLQLFIEGPSQAGYQDGPSARDAAVAEDWMFYVEGEGYSLAEADYGRGTGFYFPTGLDLWEHGQRVQVAIARAVASAAEPEAQEQQAAAPLMAEFQGAPETHNGVDSFTFRIAFSEAISTSYKTVRDHALEADGGRVRRARRVDGRSDLWEIAIKPDSDDAVSVVLPITENCGDPGAVCTSDGRMLSNGLGVIISGPQEEENGQPQPEPENAPATGLPAITGTARVGQTLTADTSGIADADGLDNATFSYQWLDDDAGISGATDSTYTLADADVGKAIRVRVGFTDDAGNEETLPSAATEAVEVAAKPLTAEFLEVSSSHDGESAFNFELRFSEEFPIGYEKLRDHVFEVTGGRATQARRLDEGSNVRWEIMVEPNGDNEVTVVLPVTDDCDDQGAVCTEDGRMLSNRTELAIPGPVADEETQQDEQHSENSPATGAPGITGTARVGETLTADVSGIADEDGLDNAAFSYQWLAGGADIEGATGSTHTLPDADAGKAVRVRVSFTDDAGNEETLTSAATAAVEPAPTPPPAPTNLTAVVNADGSVTLTWEAPDDDSVTGYRILRRRPSEGENTLLVYVENTGSAATSYTDTNVTAGTQHVYRVKAVNAAGVGGQSNYVNVDP